jgi:hypothetical protein
VDRLRRLVRPDRDHLRQVQVEACGAGQERLRRVEHERVLHELARGGGARDQPAGALGVPAAERVGAGRGGVEFDAAHTTLAKMFDTTFQQRPADATAAKVRMHQHHPDPRKRRSVNSRRGRARRCAIPLGEETAAGFGGEKTFPVRDGLVPTCERPHRIRERQVLANQQSKSERRVHAFIKS